MTTFLEITGCNVTIMDSIFKNITLNKKSFINMRMQGSNYLWKGYRDYIYSFKMIRCIINDFKIKMSSDTYLFGTLINSFASNQTYSFFDVEIKGFYCADANFPFSIIQKTLLVYNLKMRK